MNFYRFFRGAKFPGNLFVQHAGNDKLHHFKLASRQQTEKASSFILFGTVQPSLGRPCQGALNTL